MNEIEMVVDSVGIALINYQRTIILKEKQGRRRLAMWVGPLEADAIATGLQKGYSQVPLTHDFLCSVINRLGAADVPPLDVQSSGSRSSFRSIFIMLHYEFYPYLRS